MRRKGGIIPAANLAACTYCGQALDTGAAGNYVRVSGWAKVRAQGGTNAVALPEREHRYACADCVEGKAPTRDWQQLGLPMGDA